jgi:hypothetical protein
MELGGYSVTDLKTGGIIGSGDFKMPALPPLPNIIPTSSGKPYLVITPEPKATGSGGGTPTPTPGGSGTDPTATPGAGLTTPDKAGCNTFSLFGFCFTRIIVIAVGLIFLAIGLNMLKPGMVYDPRQHVPVRL